MNPITAVLGFLPILLFSLLDGRLPVGIAAAIGTAAAVVIFAVMARRTIAAMPIVQAVTLATISAIAFAGDPLTRVFLTDYGRGIASLVTAAYILITAGFAPFTAAFARANVPREHWHSRPFIELNQRISIAWGFAVLVLGLSHLLDGLIGPELRPGVEMLLNWGPTIAAVLLALRYTQRTIATAQTGAPRVPQSPQAY